MKNLFLLAGFAILLPSAAQAQSLGDELCPRPNVASKQSPSDLASVQSDIERFALCLKRAELLEQLNELSAKNTDSLLGINAGNQARGLPPMPTGDALASLPPVSADDIGLNDEFSNAPLSNSGEEDVEKDTRTPWLVNDIYGIRNNLRARITSKEGEVANVKQGDTLSDGRVVQTISRSGVVLGGKEKVDLQWAR